MPANILRDLTWANERQKLHKNNKNKKSYGKEKSFPFYLRNFALPFGRIIERK
jgi:hypothetical protein